MSLSDSNRFFVLLVMILLHGCAQDRGCADIYSEISRENAANKLESWVDERFQHWLDEGSPTLEEGRLGLPGYFAMELDMTGLPLPKKKSGYEARAIVDPDGNVKSVFLGYQNYKGVIVALEERSNIGAAQISAQKINWVSDRVGYICISRD